MIFGKSSKRGAVESVSVEKSPVFPEDQPIRATEGIDDIEELDKEDDGNDTAPPRKRRRGNGVGKDQSRPYQEAALDLLKNATETPNVDRLLGPIAPF